MMGRSTDVDGHGMTALMWGPSNQVIRMSCECGLLVAEFRPEVNGNLERALEAWAQHQQEAAQNVPAPTAEFPCSAHP